MSIVIVEKQSILNEIEIFERLNSDTRFILEIVKDEDKKWTYSYLGHNPEFYIKLEMDKVIILNKDFTFREEVDSNPLEYLKELMKTREKNLNKNIPFIGGAIGYLSYDLSKTYERKLSSNNEDVIGTPEGFFGYYKDFIVYDNEFNKVFMIGECLEEEKENKLRKLNKFYEMLLHKELDKEKKIIKEKNQIKKVISNYSKDEFCSMVDKSKKYIEEGDIFQVVLSQQLEVENTKSGIEIYKSLKKLNPSPYMYYLNFQGFQVVGTSPEILVSLKDRKAITNPIAGTILRGEKLDAELIEELKNNEKEKAEHMMLLDLGRNDIGKISEFGTVKVEEFMKGEVFSHVIHLCSKVSGTLKKELDAIDLLKSVMPAGTVSGAPKHRAMEIIEKLENRKRGIYSGAIGYLSTNGNMNMAITIRTIVLKENKAYLQAGAGIVYDSLAEKEYDETLNKLKALMEVLR